MIEGIILVVCALAILAIKVKNAGIGKEYDLWMSIPDAPYSDNEDQPAEALDAERKKRDGGE